MLCAEECCIVFNVLLCGCSSLERLAADRSKLVYLFTEDYDYHDMPPSTSLPELYMLWKIEIPRTCFQA